MNRVRLVGALDAEPAFKSAEAGRGAVLQLRLRTDDEHGVHGHRVMALGARARAMARAFRAGDRVIVEGHLVTSAYEKNGERRYATVVVAHRVLRGDKRIA